jgi:Protein of unknown function (DUF3037)
MTQSTQSPYRYTVLRYVHDITTGEFMNVGVVLKSPDSARVRAKFKLAFGRIKSAFPSVDAAAHRTRMRMLQKAFDGLNDDLASAGLAVESESLTALVKRILPADDSGLQWAPIGSGLSRDLDATLQNLYERFVTKHDTDAAADRRKDNDVWREFRSELEQRNVLSYLTRKTIEAPDDSVTFSHAWKNGAWHCFEPVSLDLASDSSIKEKAHRWLGQIASVHRSHEKFKVYFLVGKPSESRLEKAYDQAVKILAQAPESKVIEEKDAKSFSKKIANDIRAHVAKDSTF